MFGYNMAMTTKRSWTAVLPPMEPFTLNDRVHWAQRYQIEQMWQTAAAYTALQAGAPRGLDRVKVTLAIRPPDRRRRDRHNFTAMFKPCVDGLVKAGIIPDDTPGHLVSEAITIRPFEEAHRGTWHYQLIIEEA